MSPSPTTSAMRLRPSRPSDDARMGITIELLPVEARLSFDANIRPELLTASQIRDLVAPAITRADVVLPRAWTPLGPPQVRHDGPTTVVERACGEGRLVLRPVKAAAGVRPAVAEFELAAVRPGVVVAFVRDPALVSRRGTQMHGQHADRYPGVA